MTANLARSHKDYQRIIKAFFMPELVQPAEAVEMVKKPRYKRYFKKRTYLDFIKYLNNVCERLSYNE